MTGISRDVHLVVYGDGAGRVAKLLGPEPRFVLQKVTSLSMLVTILNPTTLGQLEAGGKLPSSSAAASILRAWFAQDLEKAWEKLKSERARKQELLPLGGSGDDLPLDAQ